MTVLSDFEVKRGSSYRVIGWAFDFSLEGSEIILTIRDERGRALFPPKSTKDGGLVITTIPDQGVDYPGVWFVPTVEESRLIPKGKVATYEVRRRVPGGEDYPYAEGHITGLGGG